MCFNINFCIKSKTKQTSNYFRRRNENLIWSNLIFFLRKPIIRHTEPNTLLLFSVLYHRQIKDIRILGCCTKIKQFGSVTFRFWETATGVFLHFLMFCQQLGCEKGYTKVSWILARRQIYILKPQQDSNYDRLAFFFRNKSSSPFCSGGRKLVLNRLFVQCWIIDASLKPLSEKWPTYVTHAAFKPWSLVLQAPRVRTDVRNTDFR